MVRRNIESKSIEIANKYQIMQNRMLMSDINYADNNSDIYNFVYYKVNGIASVWEEQDNNTQTSEKQPYEHMLECLLGLHSSNAPLSVIFLGDNNEISVYVGTDSKSERVLKKLLEGNFPNIEFQCNSNKFDVNDSKIYTIADISDLQKIRFGGYIKGNPCLPEQKDSTLGINKVINGMHDSTWVVSIYAQPQNKSTTFGILTQWLTNATECSELSEITFNDVDGNEGTSHRKTYFYCDKYYEKISSFCEKMESAVESGAWETTVNYGAMTSNEADILSALLLSAFHGQTSEPEPLHSIRNEAGFMPVARDKVAYHNDYNDVIPYSAITNLFNSSEVACLAMFPTTDTSGFSVEKYVGFDVSQKRDGDVCIGNIFENGRLTNREYRIPLDSFNRHCLVIGLTGGGKTNTVKSVFNSVISARQNMPFLVLEPAKREYWELYKFGTDNLQIYSIGATPGAGNPYCINPFERIGNIPLQTHIDYVFAAFKASFIMYTPMPYVLEAAIHRIYEDCGWDIKYSTNKNGEVYPTIENLYHMIPVIVDEMGYDSKMRNDLIGSLQARINSLRLGNKGQTLNVKKSFDIEQILDGRVVVELEDIGDDDVKAFIMSLFLIQLSEYRKQQTDSQLGVRHLLLIEEAHRLLKNVSSGTGENADPRGAAVEFFCNLLAELRSKGQGFMIADQIPSKLAPDLIKNTNIKILHRTVDESERALMGGAMHMNDKQKEQIAAFEQGVAAVYSEGDYHPKLVRTKYAKIFEVPERSNMTREHIVCATKNNCFSAEGYAVEVKNSFYCKKCRKYCTKAPEDIIKVIGQDRYSRLMQELNPKNQDFITANQIKERIDELVKNTLINPNEYSQAESRNCILFCMLNDWGLSEEKNEKIIRCIVEAGD